MLSASHRRDWRRVRAATHAVVPDDLPFTTLDAGLRDEWPHCTRAVVGARVVGVAWLYPTRTDDHGWLDDFGVMSEYRGRGVGSRLLAGSNAAGPWGWRAPGRPVRPA